MLIGVAVGHGFRNRRDWQTRLGRKIQLITLMREMKGYRIKGKRSLFNNWARFWLGWLHCKSPTFTRYMTLTPATLICWHRHFCKSWWSWKSRSRRVGSKRGRPKLPQNIEFLVLAVHRDNPRYGHRKIAAILTIQLGIKISETKVRNILTGHVGETPSPHSGQNWKTFLHNHRTEIASMDFKSTFDWRGRQYSF